MEFNFFTNKILVITSRNEKGEVCFIDIDSGELVYRLSMPDIRVQDLYFISKECLIIIATTGNPSALMVRFTREFYT